MGIYLSHDSAIRYWLTKTGDECLPESADVHTLAFASGRVGEIKEARLPIDYSRERPLHVLVPNRESAHSAVAVVPHVWSGPLPGGSFCALSGQNCVSSPEFALVQMARGRSLPEVMRLALCLCGRFSISDSGRDYVGSRPPLASPESIARFLKGVPGGHGTAVVREALRYLVPDAASPAEVLLVAAFVLPPRLGGWDMPPVSVNQRIDVDSWLRPVAGASYFVGDIYIPSVRGDVEFDSYEYHTGRYRLDHTQARRNVLEVMHVKTMSATWGQINTFERFETFIRMIKVRFGIPERSFTYEEREAQIELYELLTDPAVPLF